MYKEKPFYLKAYKKFLYSFCKIFLKPIDRFFNCTFEAKIKIKFLKLHSQNYKFVPNKFYYIHVPKCGGTTVHTILQKELKSELFNYDHPYNYNLSTHYPLKSSTDFAKGKFITTLRHPSFRVYSYYIDCLKNEKHAYYHVAKKGLKNFCKKVWEAQNMYIRYFSGNMKNPSSRNLLEAIKNVKKFDEIFIFEQLSNDISKFLKKNKFNQNYQIMNVKKYTKPELEYIKTIEKFNQMDIEFYNQVLEFKNLNYKKP